MDINNEFQKINILLKSTETYNDLVKHLTNKELIFNTKNLLDILLNINTSFQKVKIFLSMWLITQYPNDFFDSNYADELLYKISIEITSSKVIYTQKEAIYNLFDEFYAWKEKDKIKLEEHLVTNYFNLQYNIDSIINDKSYHLLENEDLKEFVQLNKKEQEKIKERLVQLNNNNTDILQKIDNYNYSRPKSLFEKVSQCIDDAYWNKIKEDLKNKDFETFKLLLKDIEQILSFILHKNEKKLHEINEYFDIDFIISQLTHDALSFDEILTIIKYLYKTLTEIQAPIDDSINEKWFNELIYNKDNILIYEFIVIFFKEYMNKIIKIFRIVKELQQ